MNTIARIRKNGDLFIIGELAESGDKDVSFDTDGNLYTSNFKEVANISAVSRFLDGMQISGELHEGMIDKPIMDGLELWYDFRDKSNDDEHRDVAQDLSGNGNDGELVNFAFEEGSGYVGGGLRFDGVDDVVTIAPSLATEYTWEIVITPNVSTSDSMFLGGANRGQYMRIMDNRFHMLTTSEPSRQVFLNTPPVNGSTFHLAVSAGDSTYKFFVNGLLDTEVNVESVLSNSVIRIGYWSDIDKRPFRGDIHNFRSYSRALSDEEVAHNYALEKERWSI